MGFVFSKSREYAWPSWQLTHGNPSRQLNCLSLGGSYAMKCHEVPIFPIHLKGSICIYIIIYIIYSDQCAKQCQNVHGRFSLLILLQKFIILLHICIPVSLLVYISMWVYRYRYRYNIYYIDMSICSTRLAPREKIPRDAGPPFSRMGSIGSSRHSDDLMIPEPGMRTTTRDSVIQLTITDYWW